MENLCLQLKVSANYYNFVISANEMQKFFCLLNIAVRINNCKSAQDDADLKTMRRYEYTRRNLSCDIVVGVCGKRVRARAILWSGIKCKRACDVNAFFIHVIHKHTTENIKSNL